MEPSIHMFAWGDRNPLTYHRQVPGVKRLVVDLGGAPGQIHERVWINHVLNELAEVGLRLSVVESFFVSNAIKLELSERDQHVEAFCQTLRNYGSAIRVRGGKGPFCLCIGYDPKQPEPEVEQLDDRPRLGYPESYTEREYQQLVGLCRERGEEGLWDALMHFLRAINSSSGRKRRMDGPPSRRFIV